LNTVSVMRQAHLRTLATRGIEISSRLGIRGIEAHQAIDNQGEKLLVFSGGLLGTSWASVGFVLEQQGIRHTIISLGRPYFVCSDTQELRELLFLVTEASRVSAREDILIQDVGFVRSELDKKFDYRALIAPLIILALTLAFGASQIFRSEVHEDPEQEQVVPAISCALDLDRAVFDSWIKGQLGKRRLEASSQFAIQTELGEVAIEVDQVLGSTHLISGTLTCEDGRAVSLKFRTDGQRPGELIELGEKLDP
jgi:hypothetical protein